MGVCGGDNNAPAFVAQAREIRMNNWMGRLMRTHAHTEASELVGLSEASGAEPIKECVRGEKVRVCGTIRSLALRPQTQAPFLEAELYDGTGMVRLIWLGRRRLPGIEVGRTVVAEGRITCPQNDMTMYNPRYVLQPLDPS